MKNENHVNDVCLPGDPFPSIWAEGKANLNYSLDAAAGRYLVVANLVNASEACFDDAVSAIKSHRALFNDTDISFLASWMPRVHGDRRLRIACREYAGFSSVEMPTSLCSEFRLSAGSWWIQRCVC